MDKSPAFVAAEAGYDVWIGNLRGNKYSLGHDTLDYIEDGEAYFDFDISTHSRIDLVTMVDYILSLVIEYPKIAYVGHSMGTTIMFQLASENPFYVESKISSVIALAPALVPSHTTSLFVKKIIPIQD